MTLTYRTAGAWGPGKGSPLTMSEQDNNTFDLDGRVDALETAGVQPDEISNITVIGTQMTIHMQSGDTWGPFTLPAAAMVWKGNWVPLTLYKKYDIINVSATGIYFVNAEHTSEATFNSAAGGGTYYKLMLLKSPIVSIPGSAEFRGVRVRRGLSIASTALTDNKIPWDVVDYSTTTGIFSTSTPTDFVNPAAVLANRIEANVHLLLSGVTAGDTFKLRCKVNNATDYFSPYVTHYIHGTSGSVLLATGALTFFTPAHFTIESLGGNTFTIDPLSTCSFRLLDGASTIGQVSTNASIPEITGTAKVGLTLTGFEGFWTNTPGVYLFQWQADGVNIPGATATSYVPVTGDIGKVITLEVIAINFYGASLTAESFPTAAVIA